MAGLNGRSIGLRMKRKLTIVLCLALVIALTAGGLYYKHVKSQPKFNPAVCTDCG